MKIAVTSDHHFHPYTQFARRLDRGINSRLAEMLEVEDYAHERRLELGIDLHIRCGDLWDRKNVIDAVTFQEVYGRLAGYTRPPIEELALMGNHDTAAGGIRSTLEALNWAGGAVRMHDQPDFLRRDNVYIAVVPHHDDPCYQRAAIKKVSEAARYLTDCRILCAHVQIAGAQSGSEFVLPGALSVDDLYLDCWDYVFLGHVHEPQQLAKNCWYVGSQCQRSFSDEGSARRMFILNTDNATLDEELLPGPKFERLRVQSEADWDSFTPNEDTYYRISLETPAVTSRMVRDAIADKCKGIVFSHGIWTPQLAPRLETRSTRWEDLMQEYVKFTNPPLDHNRLLERGAQLRSFANADS